MKNKIQFKRKIQRLRFSRHRRILQIRMKKKEIERRQRVGFLILQQRG